MLAVKGIYDGEHIKPLEPIVKNKKYNVIITFMEEIKTDEIREFTSDSNAFDFWENEKEDIYQDYLERGTK